MLCNRRSRIHVLLTSPLNCVLLALCGVDLRTAEIRYAGGYHEVFPFTLEIVGLCIRHYLGIVDRHLQLSVAVVSFE